MFFLLSNYLRLISPWASSADVFSLGVQSYENGERKKIFAHEWLDDWGQGDSPEQVVLGER